MPAKYVFFENFDNLLILELRKGVYELNKLINDYFDSLAEILSYEGDTYGRIVRHKGLIGSNGEEVFYNF